jgi:hypothetical protein
MVANTVQRLTLSDGPNGTDETVDAMAKVAMGQFGAGSVRIRNLTLDIIRQNNVAEKDQLGEVKAVHDWVMNHLRYVRDPYGIEFLTYPETLAFDRTDGDCDDHVILEAAMLGSIGIPTRFITVGFQGKPYSHVYMGAMLNNNTELLPLDPIVKNKPAGWEAPNPTSKKVYPINDARGVSRGTIGVSEVIALLVALLLLKGKRRVRSR